VSEPPAVAHFIAGVLTAGFAVAAAFFLRFWVRTREELFASLSAAFCLLAANQAVAGLTRSGGVEDVRAYLLRLAAFVLIIIAILRKSGTGSPGA